MVSANPAHWIPKVIKGAPIILEYFPETNKKSFVIELGDYLVKSTRIIGVIWFILVGMVTLAFWKTWIRLKTGI